MELLLTPRSRVWFIPVELPTDLSSRMVSVVQVYVKADPHNNL